jgi:UDP-N-acetylglucosamine 2-epimerase
LNIKFLDKSLLITFHPETLDIEGSEYQFKELLKALSNFNDTTLIFTMPNADTGGRNLINMVEEFVNENKNAKAFKSLGQLLYFSCILNMDGVVGNSSSGVIEVPSFKKAICWMRILSKRVCKAYEREACIELLPHLLCRYLGVCEEKMRYDKDEEDCL